MLLCVGSQYLATDEGPKPKLEIQILISKCRSLNIICVKSLHDFHKWGEILNNRVLHVCTPCDTIDSM